MNLRVERLFQDYGWKMVSLLLAVFCWLMIDAGVDGPAPASDGLGFRTRTFVLPITVMTTASDSRRFSVRPASVEVVVHGRNKIINQLQNSDLQVFVDLVDIPEAQELKKRIVVHTPTDVKVQHVDPDQVTIERLDSAPPIPR